MRMSEADICREYREAKRKGIQVGILADLNVCSREEILRILILNGMNVTPAGRPNSKNDKVMDLMCTMLDEQEDQIRAAEKRYLQIVESIKQYGKGGRKDGKRRTGAETENGENTQ